MNNSTVDTAAKSKSLSSKSIIRLYKQNMMLKIIEIKFNEPRLTQKQISKQLGYSDSTFKRYRDDTNMDSPYSRNKHKKKNNKSNTSITQFQSHTTHENTNNSKNTENKKRKTQKVVLF